MLKRIWLIALAVMTAAAGLAPPDASAGHRNHHSYKSGFKHHGHKSHSKHHGHKRHFKRRNFGHHFRGRGFGSRYKDFGHLHRFRHNGFKHRSFKKHHGFKGRHHGGFSFGLGYGPDFFAPYKYHRPHRRLYRGGTEYIEVIPGSYSDSSAPWSTPPSAPVKETAPVFYTPADTNPSSAIPEISPVLSIPQQAAAAPAPLETSGLTDPAYVNIGAYDASQNYSTAEPLEIVPASSGAYITDTAPDLSVHESTGSLTQQGAEIYVVRPGEPQALPPLETVPLN